MLAPHASVGAADTARHCGLSFTTNIEDPSMKLSAFLIAGTLLLAASAARAQGINDAQIASIVVTAN
jgi:hypothetical protein